MKASPAVEAVVSVDVDVVVDVDGDGDGLSDHPHPRRARRRPRVKPPIYAEPPFETHTIALRDLWG